ncbi:MAG: MAPEG family protein [Alphaproteobacteria bacterium]|nr:MAPEG family protein [Alphaproteobacteria bacterium]
MIIPHITAFYAGFLGLMLVALSWRIMAMRARLEVVVGDGGEKNLSIAVRMQGNFIEYVPMALLLIAFNEIIARPSWVIHALCLLLVAARLAHVHGMSQKNAMGRGRRLGAMMTFAVIVAASILCIASMIMGRV